MNDTADTPNAAEAPTPSRIVPSLGRPTLRCLLRGHQPGFRNPGDPHAWLALACQRCCDYPLNSAGRYRGTGYAHAAKQLRAQLGIAERAEA